MNPQIEHRPQMTLMGLSVLSEGSMDTTPLWQRIEKMEHRFHFAVPTARYMIFTWGVETEQARPYYLFAGVEITRVEAPPISAVIKILPAAEYAIFATRASELAATWKHALEVWLPRSPYQPPGFVLERYDRARYLEAQPGQREVDLYLPLRLKPEHAPPREQRKRARKE